MAKILTTTEVLGYTLDTYTMFSPTDYLVNDTDIADYDIDFEGYKQGLAKLAENILSNELQFNPGVVLSVSIGDVKSPREYNFTTDKGDADVDVDLKALREYIENNRTEFSEYIKENYTSYDGFISFVENSYDSFMAKFDLPSGERDGELHKGAAVGWYMRRELISQEEYHQAMWEGYGEVIYENLTSVIYTEGNEGE